MEKLDGIAHRIPTGVYKLLLVVATVIWGLSFVVMKDAVDVLQPAYLIGFRFLATGAILAALFFRRLRAALSGERAVDYLVKGTILGVVCYLAFWVQTIGLDHTTPGKNAFLTATYCVIVPFAWWAIARKRPTAFNLVAAVMAVGGIGLVSLSGSLSELSMGFGDAMTLVSALLFAVHIVYVSKFSEKSDVLVLTLLQFAVGGVCGVAYGACFETLPPGRVPHAGLLDGHGLPRGVRVVRGPRHPERGPGARAARAGLAVPELGERVRRAVQRAAVWGRDRASPGGRLRPHLRCYSGERNVPAETQGGRRRPRLGPGNPRRPGGVAGNGRRVGRPGSRRQGSRRIEARGVIMEQERNNIVLIGMPSAGKSTLGIVLAKILNYQFVDADLVIQNQCDKTLQKLIDACGPEGFIQVENEILRDIEAENSIIATGGSAVYSDEAMKHLAEIGRVVYLQISYEELVSRLHDLQERGVVLKGGIGMSLRELYDERKPLYEQYAEITVNIDDLSITAASRKVADALR